jgi:hypothetical protein
MTRRGIRRGEVRARGEISNEEGNYEERKIRE